MKTHILKREVEDILQTMSEFVGGPDSFELEIDSSSGIGRTITVSTNIIYHGLAGKFVVVVCGSENW